MGSSQSPQHSSSSRAKRKKGKHFLERKDTLTLAAAIGGLQEEKALDKVVKQHKDQSGQPQLEQRTRSSTSRDKIKETKALLVSQRAHFKKEKARRRKDMLRLQDKPSTDELTSEAVDVHKTRRKTVSFS